MCGNEVSEFWWFGNACVFADFGEKDFGMPWCRLWVREERRLVFVVADGVLRDDFVDFLGQYLWGPMESTCSAIC